MIEAIKSIVGKYAGKHLSKKRTTQLVSELVAALENLNDEPQVAEAPVSQPATPEPPKTYVKAIVAMPDMGEDGDVGPVTIRGKL